MMKKNSKKIMGFSLLLVSVNVFAERPAICESEKNVDLVACGEHYYSIADKRLNERYKQFSQSLSDADKNLLKSGQRDWIKFRDEYCSEFDPQKAGQGQEAAIDFLSCKTQLTNSRSFEIQALMDDGGSDLFDKTIAKISEKYSKAGIDNIKKEIVISGKGSKFFDDYAKKNCDLSLSISNEPLENCLSRVYFIGK